MKKIIVIGSANTDMVVKCATLPFPGETVLGGTFFMNAGGKGANQAVAAARLGGEVTFVAKVGNDIFGRQTVADLQKENIDTKFVFTDEQSPSGVALIIVNHEGENCIAVAPGANACLQPADIEKVSLHEAGIILMQLEIPVTTISAVVNKARLNRQRIILNPAPAMLLPDELISGLFLITPNETEVAFLTGITVTDTISASKAAGILLDKDVQNVIITLGRQGAYFKNKEEAFTIPAPTVNAIDTTAAGDTFSGAVTVALTENMNWQKVVQFAVNAAAVSVTRLGAQASVPYRSELGL
ncbi:ribokinase [Ferruginibacter paludis]|uniref:ribokinase n=1 Tax=Ferruginibacter paludis TaxID=1310417 RepID=UPI0025B305A4|nr:ribokinase [Ferruginibacter paludis]MDN3657566.1 ribokinase [Ferruginibacter paludis]